MPNQSSSSLEKKLTIELQGCDGLTTATCPTLGIVGFGKSRDRALKEVFDSIITNSKVVIKKQESGEPLNLDRERMLSQLAQRFLEHQGDIQSLFLYKQL